MLKCNTSLNESLLNVENCCQMIGQWMTLNKLKLNCEKTEFLLVANSNFFSKLDVAPVVRIGDSIVKSVTYVRNLGGIFDYRMTMTNQVNDVVRKGSFVLRGIRKVNRYTTLDVRKTLVASTILSRIDFLNSLYTNLSRRDLHRLNVLMNNAARLITKTGNRSPITPVLKDLHWLRVEYRIRYKCCIFVHKSLYSEIVPNYISKLCCK